MVGNLSVQRSRWLAVFAVLAGSFCVIAYTQSSVLQDVLLGFLRRYAYWLEEYAWSYDPEIYERVGSGYLRVLIWLTPAWFLLAVGLLPLARIYWRQPVADFIVQHSMHIAILIAVMVSVGAFAAATFVTEYHPITNGDEYGYIFTSKLLASGRLYSTAGANMEEFSNWAIITTGPRRYNVHLPGNGLVLVLGQFAGNVYLIPALGAGLSTLLVFFVGRNLFSPGTALIAVILLATSPFFILFHGTLLPQTTLLPCLLLFLLCAVHLAREFKWYWLVIGAGILPLATFIRPQSVVLFAGPVALYLMFVRHLTVRHRLLIALAGIVSISLGALALLVYSSAVTGQPISLGVSGLSPHPPGQSPFCGHLGFHMRHNHTPTKGLVNTTKGLAGWDYFLFGWPVSFLPIFVWFFRRGKNVWEYVLLASVLCYYGFYFFWHAVMWWYYLDTVPLLALVSAAVIYRRPAGAYSGRETGGALERDDNAHFSRGASERRDFGDSAWTRSMGTRQAPTLLQMLLVVGIGLSVVAWPYAIGRVKRTAHQQKIKVSEAIRAVGIKSNAIVLLDERLPYETLSAVGRNSPDIDNDVVLAKKLPGERWRRTAAMFPGRTVWVLREDTGGRLRCSPLKQDEGVNAEEKGASVQSSRG